MKELLAGLKEIEITEIDGLRFGNAQDIEAMTGVTVVIFDKQNRGGVDVSGGGPASRESRLLDPLSNNNSLNALVFSGGSAYGLDAATGVMTYLEERGKGYQVHDLIVPLVSQSCIFDLTIGSSAIRPNAEMGYQACLAAETNQPLSGSFGAGTGATIGKVFGMQQAQKSGIGYFAVSCGELQMGAMVVVNAVGDVYDTHTSEKIGGLLTSERTAFLDSETELYRMQSGLQQGGNTTIAAVFTNACFSQAEMNKIASMARAAFGRAIRPVGTMADGDTIYAFSVGEVQADINIAGTLAAHVLSEAILNAVKSATMTDEDYLQLIK